MQNTSFIKFILLILTCCVLSACGFHPRGDASLPPKLRLLYFTSTNPYGQFEQNLKKALQTVGVALVNSPTDAPVTLKILKTSLVSTPSSIGTSSQATVYTVTFDAQMTLLDSHGRVLYAPQDITSASTMIVNAQQVLNSTNQLDTLSQQLQQDVISQIFGILSSRQVANAVYSTSPT